MIRNSGEWVVLSRRKKNSIKIVATITTMPIGLLKGAFKTPSLRDVERTASYFHDGSAETLMDVVDHYARGGDVKTNLSANLKPLALTKNEKEDLVAFMLALSSPETAFTLPALPTNELKGINR